MSLKIKIREDLESALKEKRQNRLSALRMLLAAVSNREIDKRTRAWKEKPELSTEDLKKESQLTDEEIFETISSEIKKRKEAIDLYEKGNRLELAEKEKKEIEVLQSYLPKQMSEEEIKRTIEEVIKKVGAKEMKDIGKVMKELMPQVKDRADNSLVSKAVKELLG
ncbi:hypothetical protein AMJ48_01490 [Parcubacteria bacterium DG_74_1]|nr:MAG: hypothetical protein AMJ48_01490 [Parcubacteria bacterium DG_74_1]